MMDDEERLQGFLEQISSAKTLDDLTAAAYLFGFTPQITFFDEEDGQEEDAQD